VTSWSRSLGEAILVRDFRAWAVPRKRVPMRMGMRRRSQRAAGWAKEAFTGSQG
jgi:hypothetical protein